MLGWVLFIRISVIIIAYCAFMIQQDGAFFKYMYMCPQCEDTEVAKMWTPDA